MRNCRPIAQRIRFQLSEHKEPVKPPTLEEIMLAGYEREMADAIFAEEQRAYRTREKPYGPNKRRMPAQWPPETKET